MVRLLVFILAFSALAQAKERGDQWYFSVGANKFGDMEIPVEIVNARVFGVLGPAIDLNGTTRLHDDSSLRVAVGREIKGFRIESEIIWINYEYNHMEFQSLQLYHHFNSIASGDPRVLKRVNDTSSLTGDFSAKTAMIKAYYDVDTGTKWVPYVMVGAGISKIEIDAQAVVWGITRKVLTSGSEKTFQAGIGLKYKVSDNFDAYVGHNRFRIEEGHEVEGDSITSALYSSERNTSYWGAGFNYRWGGKQ